VSAGLRFQVIEDLAIPDEMSCGRFEVKGPKSEVLTCKPAETAVTASSCLDPFGVARGGCIATHCSGWLCPDAPTSEGSNELDSWSQSEDAALKLGRCAQCGAKFFQHQLAPSIRSTLSSKFEAETCEVHLKSQSVLAYDWPSEHAGHCGTVKTGSKLTASDYGEWLRIETFADNPQAEGAWWLSSRAVFEAAPKEAPVADAQSPEIIFICGAGRSGTTLLADLLGMHEEMTPVYETEFITTAILKFFCSPSSVRFDTLYTEFHKLMEDWSKDLPRKPGEKASHEKFHHGEHHFKFEAHDVMDQTTRFLDRMAKSSSSSDSWMEPFRDLCSSLFEIHLKQAQQTDPKKRIVVNKTPSYSYIIPVLAHLFPSAKFIHCVRDGRAVAHSVVDLTFGPNSIEEAAHWWADRVTQGRTWSLTHPGEIIEVVYEHVVSQPFVELQRIQRELNVKDDSSAMIENRDGKFYYGDNIPISSQYVSSWRSKPQTEFTEAFRRYASILKHFGYSDLPDTIQQRCETDQAKFKSGHDCSDDDSIVLRD
jgi:hypothetical protein